MSSETSNDPSEGSTDRAFLDALQKYVADGRPVSSDESLDPEAPSFSFTVQADIFEGYVTAEGVEADGDD